ncbi:hypothetical protein CUMW_149750 [Citrus unshiu]|nr:hypothetical protein CUMW_149750 [Citrus unshiu]
MIARTTMGQWFNLLVCALLILKAQACFNVSITYVEDAVAKGAVCLDGSPPAYHFDKGFGAGINNWLVHIDGGAWCNNVADCSNRRDSSYGSSKYMVKEANFTGILSNEQKFNPDFYDWNRVKVRYCDGASFTGDVEAVNPETNLHFRGARVFEAVMEDLLAKGMKNAQNAILTGCSAGGLTSILHCDNFRALFPVDTRVKCFADAGYFVNVNILVPDNADPKGTWRRCKKDIKTCSSTQLQTMQGFRVQFLNALAGLGNSSSRGMLIDSCYTHCRTVFQEAWLSADSPVLDKTPIAKAVGDWYYDRNPFQKIDCPYPCNPLPESCF